MDLELVEKGTRGYKAAAIRARRATLEASKELKEIRKPNKRLKKLSIREKWQKLGDKKN